MLLYYRMYHHGNWWYTYIDSKQNRNSFQFTLVPSQHTAVIYLSFVSLCISKFNNTSVQYIRHGMYSCSPKSCPNINNNVKRTRHSGYCLRHYSCYRAYLTQLINWKHNRIQESLLSRYVRIMLYKSFWRKLELTWYVELITLQTYSHMIIMFLRMVRHDMFSQIIAITYSIRCTSV